MSQWHIKANVHRTIGEKLLCYLVFGQLLKVGASSLPIQELLDYLATEKDPNKKFKIPEGSSIEDIGFDWNYAITLSDYVPEDFGAANDNSNDNASEDPTNKISNNPSENPSANPSDNLSYDSNETIENDDLLLSSVAQRKNRLIKISESCQNKDLNLTALRKVLESGVLTVE